MTPPLRQTCAVCGRALPNRFAVAGTCEADGCEAVFCALHWRNGNRRCPAHGWKPGGILAPRASVSVPPSSEHKEKTPMPVPEPESKETPAAAPAPDAKALTPSQKKSAVRSAFAAVAKLGSAAGALLDRLRGVQDPQAMIDSFNASLEENRRRREPLAARADELFRTIAAKKKVYEAAPPARKRLLGLELQSLLADYKGCERQLTALYENERTLTVVRSRVEEVVALELRKVSEKQIDELVDRVDDAVEEAEDVRDAVGDLEKAGKRRERASDAESFEDELAAFDLPASELAAPAAAPAADAAAPVPAPRVPASPEAPDLSGF